MRSFGFIAIAVNFAAVLASPTPAEPQASEPPFDPFTLYKPCELKDVGRSYGKIEDGIRCVHFMAPNDPAYFGDKVPPEFYGYLPHCPGTPIYAVKRVLGLNGVCYYEHGDPSRKFSCCQGDKNLVH